jgi:hypothetical protein
MTSAATIIPASSPVGASRPRPAADRNAAWSAPMAETSRVSTRRNMAPELDGPGPIASWTAPL